MTDNADHMVKTRIMIEAQFEAGYVTLNNQQVIPWPNLLIAEQ